MGQAAPRRRPFDFPAKLCDPAAGAMHQVPSQRPLFRLLWVCGSSVMGGAENATLLAVRSLRQRGHRADVLCGAGSPVAQAAGPAGLQVHSAPLGGSLNLRAWWSVALALRRARSDIVLVTTTDEWVWACLAPRPRGTRLVLARHMALRLPRRVLRLAGRRADAIIAVSGAVRDSLLGGAEIAPSRVRVIGVASRFAPAANVPHTDDRRDARRALGLPAAGHWLGFFGGTDAGKGLDHALGATVAANHASPPVHLLAGGHRAGSQDAGLVAARARDVGLEGRVHWRGRIERMEVALRAVDVVVVPTRSRLGEAMPLTVAEAMALGTPVVAYAVGGIPEILGGGDEAGRLVTADDSDAFARAVVEALADAGETRARAERALARVRTHFAVDAMAAAYEELFLGLLRK